MNILDLQNICKHFGGVHAVDQCGFSVKQGSVTGLIGPNGAGKTTLFNIISGFLTANNGEIYFQGRDITRLSPFRRARLGISRTFQDIRLFPELSVLDNVMIGFPDSKDHLWQAFIPQKKHREKLKLRAEKLLESVDLLKLAYMKTYELSYGQQKLLSLLRAKARKSTFIMLDEPAAGINPSMIRKITAFIKALQKEGRTFLIVEHNMPFIMGLCETVVVMDRGREIATGKPKEIQENAKVLEAYLGEKKPVISNKTTS